MLTLTRSQRTTGRRPSREVPFDAAISGATWLPKPTGCVTNELRMRIVGRRDRIPAELLRAIRAAEDPPRRKAPDSICGLPSTTRP